MVNCLIDLSGILLFLLLFSIVIYSNIFVNLVLEHIFMKTHSSIKPSTYFFIISFILIQICLMSCKDDNIVSDDPDTKPTVDEILVSSNVVNISSEGGDCFITVTSDANVAISCDEDWVNPGFIVGKKEDNFKISVKKNNNPLERKAEIELKAENAETVLVEVVQEGLKSNACDLLSFSINGNVNGLNTDLKFKYDERANTFSAMYLKWIDRNEPEMMIPDFKINGSKVLVNGNEIVSGETKLSFADDFTIIVEAESGKTKEYKISLNCPQINRELAVLHFKPEREITDKDNYVDTEIELYDKTPEATGDGWWNSEEKGTVEMRGRGNSTWILPKKPYRIKFPEKFSPIGLNHAKEKSWTLLAQDMDKSLIRTHIAFEYSKILYNPTESYHHEKAVLFTPASKYVNVYITGYNTDVSTGKRSYKDGEYLGVYQMSDQVEQASGRIGVEKLEESDGSDPTKITGGYVIETDLHEGNHYSAYKKIQMSYKYPKDDDCDPAQYEYITNFINEAEATLYSENFKDPVNGWRKYFDEKTLADFIIIKEFVGDLDGYASTYMYKRRGVDKLFFGPIWDCDKGWDNDRRVPHSQYPPLESLMIYAGFWMPRYVEYDWFWRFWEDETFRQFVSDRWNSKKTELQAVTDRVLDEVPQKMSKAIEANFTVWPFYYQYSTEAKMPAENYGKEIERIRELSRKRANLLDRLLK